MKKRIVGGLFFALLAAAVVFLLLPVKSISFEGNAYYSEKDLRDRIFGDEKPRYYIVRIKELLGGHADIPFVEHYELHFEEERKITVRLYEKQLAGYLTFQNYYLYFDWDGVLVESSTQKLDGLYEVTGLDIRHAVVGEKLPVADEYVIRTVQTISQYISREEIMLGGQKKRLGDLCRSIRFQSGGVSVEYGDISVFLGGSDNMEAKLFLMTDILPELLGRRGTLYLDSYRSGTAHPTYAFKEKE